MIIIAVIIISLLLAALLARKISKDYAKDREYIQQRGGMRTVYATFINGILEYPSAKIEEEEGNRLCISGDFTDNNDDSKHGGWTLNLKHTFNVLQVSYNTKMYFNDVIQGEKHWEFPITADQQKMLETVKTQMNDVSSHDVHL